MTISEYKLTDLLSSAGATIGIIISGTIFLEFMSKKYIELNGIYRKLTGEYREIEAGEGRHSRLQSQIRTLRRRLIPMNRASRLASVALLCFLTAVLAGGASVMFPPVRPMKTVETIGLLVGLVLIGCAVAIELVETSLSREELGEEVGDLYDLDKDDCKQAPDAKR